MEILKTKDNILAAELLEKADSKALFELFKKSEKEKASIVEAMSLMTSQFGPDGMRINDDAPINAMKEVALKALELAQSVLNDKK